MLKQKNSNINKRSKNFDESLHRRGFFIAKSNSTRGWASRKTVTVYS